MLGEYRYSSKYIIIFTRNVLDSLAYELDDSWCLTMICIFTAFHAKHIEHSLGHMAKDQKARIKVAREITEQFNRDK